MTENTLDRTTSGFGLSFALTSLLSAILVIVKEEYHDTVWAAMKSLTGHHWVTHGIVAVALFVVLGLVLARTSSPLRSGTLSLLVVGSTVLSGLLIAAYFV
jgi:hypothetical protein